METIIIWISNNLITTISTAVILVTFIYFLCLSLKIMKLSKSIKKACNNADCLTTLKGRKLNSLKESYEKTIVIETSDGRKSNIPASEFFSEYNTCKEFGINLRLLDTASGTLVGLGLLGTFLGLTIGIWNFDSTSTDNIQSSIQMLLDGMATAFITSLVGMFFSLIYTFFDKRFKHRLSKNLYAFTEKLDNQYYIDDVSLAHLKQEELIKELYANVKSLIEEQSRNIIGNIQYLNAEGEIVPIGNAVREILTENVEQSRALKSFSTDLALELNNGFDEVMSRQMQQKILPLMENVDATTKAIVEHIDKMAEQVASPATDMIQNVVEELKNSMSEVIAEFNNNLSGSATQELEGLAMQLSTTTQALTNLPQNIENISTTLQITIDEVKSAVSDISNTSASANSTAMQQMQEQITFATGAISNAIAEVKDVMNGITQSSQEQSNQMINKLSDAADKMGTFLNATVSSLSSSVQESVKNIAEDVNSRQADLIALQEDTTTQTRKLLEAFNTGLERLEKINEYIAGTMDAFQQAQGQITGSTTHLQTITGDMKQATQLFNKGQNEYATKIAEIQINSQRGIDDITELLGETEKMSSEYVEKFEIIKQGIGGIFAQLQAGLSEYSKTVQVSTQKYLDQYSVNLTDVIVKLSGIADALVTQVEELNDTLTRK